jgi:hypothetical protein
MLFLCRGTVEESFKIFVVRIKTARKKTEIGIQGLVSDY